jgi:predicted RNase H-like nuclease (RuvC/YqgF family)
MRTEETKARRQCVQLQYKLDAANLALERAIKGKDRMVGNLKAALQDMTRRYEEEHRRRIHAEQEANRQRHLYQDMTHIAQQLMRQLDELKAAGAGGAA